MPDVEFAILGPLRVRHADSDLRVGGLLPRALLATLLTASGAVVSEEGLIDEIWGEELPGNARNSLQTNLSRLRGALGPLAGRLSRHGGGYRLEVRDDELDAHRVEGLVRAARADPGDPQRAVQLLWQAIALWRGVALQEFTDLAPTAGSRLGAERVRFDQLRDTVEVEYLDALLAAGRSADALVEARRVATRKPLAERPHRALALALYRTEQTSAALDVLRAYRERLAEETGLDPGESFDGLEREVLARDPSLRPHPAAHPPPTEAPPTTAGPLPPESPVLIATKLQPPPVRNGFVSRPELLAHLRNNSQHRLTLVSAPAGWGKTSLLAAWTQDPEERRSIGWVGLDESDTDPTTFWSYVLEALRRLRPDLLAQVRMGSASVTDISTRTIPALVNAFADAPDQTCLVLDDLHLIDEPEISQGLALLLDRLPRSLHVVLSSRYDPPLLPIPRLRARGDLAEIRVAELRMNRNQAGDLLTNALGSTPAAGVIGRLHERTEGWPAGLYLAALSARNSPDATERDVILTADEHAIGQYLATEVLNRLDLRDRRFLLDTCVCDRLTAGLCNAVTGDDDGGAMLDRIERVNLFLVPLDPERTAYRYHHLFRDLLRRHLNETHPASMPDLHRRAATWHRQHGDPADAIHHLLLAGDDQQAADLLAQAFSGLTAGGRLGTYGRLLEQVPQSVIDNRPLLMVVAAYNEHLRGRYQRLGEVLDQVETRYDLGAIPFPAMVSVASGVTLLRAWQRLRTSGDLAGAIDLARPTIKVETDPMRGGLWYAFGTLAELLWLNTAPEQALAVLQSAPHIPDAPEASVNRATLAAWQALIRCDLEIPGNTEQIEILARRALAEPEGQGPEGFVARLALGRLALAGGDPIRAEEILQDALTRPRYWQDLDLLQRGYAWLAEAVMQQGRTELAKKWIQLARTAEGDYHVAGSTTSLLRTVARAVTDVPP